MGGLRFTCLIITALLTAFILIHALSRSVARIQENYRLAELRQENLTLKNKLPEWENKIKTLKSALETLNKRNDDLRVAAALSGPQREYGVGGPSPTGGYSFAALRETHPIETDLSILESSMTQLGHRIAIMENAVIKRKTRVAHYPSIMPVRHGWISSSYGHRLDPFTGLNEEHLAIDISIKPGSEIYSPAAGTIKSVNTKVTPNKGYGQFILIDHGYGYQTFFAHLSKAFVKEGQQVKRWDLIGLSGSTGKSTAPHLHYAVFVNGEPKNPIDYILE